VTDVCPKRLQDVSGVPEAIELRARWLLCALCGYEVAMVRQGALDTLEVPEECCNWPRCG
jgi:hypothetical protein